jgi:hypothetical protein
MRCDGCVWVVVVEVDELGEIGIKHDFWARPQNSSRDTAPNTGDNDVTRVRVAGRVCVR